MLWVTQWVWKLCYARSSHSAGRCYNVLFELRVAERLSAKTLCIKPVTLNKLPWLLANYLYKTAMDLYIEFLCWSPMVICKLPVLKLFDYLQTSAIKGPWSSADFCTKVSCLSADCPYWSSMIVRGLLILKFLGCLQTSCLKFHGCLQTSSTKVPWLSADFLS